MQFLFKILAKFLFSIQFSKSHNKKKIKTFNYKTKKKIF